MRAPIPEMRVAQARDDFLTSGDVPPTAVQDAILTSWRRSRGAGVDTELPDVPYDEAFDARSRLTRCATPVMHRLHEQLSDMPVSIVLTDERGRLVDRRDSDRALARRFDTVCFAPGFSYAETHVGTNGVGTALEEGRPVFVSGPEHFNSRSLPFACAGGPIRNPLTGRLEGLIDLSSLAEDAHPMMRVLVQEAALDIERRLLEDGSERQRLVLDEFLAACRRSRGEAVISVSGDVVIANKRASSLLTAADEDLLRLTAVDARRLAPDAVTEMSLSDGRWAQVRCRPVTHHLHDVAGAVFEVRLAETRAARRPVRSGATVPLPGLVGSSRAWLDCCAQAREAAHRRAPLLVVGEQGSGKLALARATHQAADPATGAPVVDFERDAPSDLGELLFCAAVPRTVVLRRLDKLGPQAQQEVADLLAEVPAGAERPWLVATVRAGAAIEDCLLRYFTTSVTVPPLRHRGDDLPALASAVLGRVAPGRHVEFEADALAVLTRNAWPGNLTELSQVLRTALARRPVGSIRREDLPAGCFTTSRRALSPIEALERDAIVRTLTETDGNRKLAAERLGMSRSSLYRKIHSYGITPADERDAPVPDGTPGT